MSAKPQNALPPCPMCGNSRHSVPQGEPGLFICTKHGMLYDVTDDGGDYSDRNPAARLEREERRQKRA
jgi:hypothetical protein